MATTEEYLNKLVEDKDSLKQSFADRGVDVSDADTFTALAAKAAELPTGGGSNVYKLNFSEYAKPGSGNAHEGTFTITDEENLNTLVEIKEKFDAGEYPLVQITYHAYGGGNITWGKLQTVLAHYSTYQDHASFQTYLVALPSRQSSSAAAGYFDNMQQPLVIDLGKRGQEKVINTFALGAQSYLNENRYVAASEVLLRNNTGSWTPQNPYQPSTKKYVDDSINKISSYKSPNVIIVGEPTIQDSQVSNFTADNYLMFPYVVDFDDRRFQINFSFTTSGNVTNQQNILDSEFGLALAIRDRKVVFVISEDGTSWAGEHVSASSINTTTTYKARITWTRSIYSVELSSNDGVSYTTYISFSSTAHPYPKTMYIGNSVSHANAFTGSINLIESSLQIDGETVWSGVDSVPFESKLNIDLSNIDETGREKIKEIAGDSSIEYVPYAWMDNNNPIEITALKPNVPLIFTSGGGTVFYLKFTKPNGTVFTKQYSFSNMVSRLEVGKYYMIYTPTDWSAQPTSGRVGISSLDNLGAGTTGEWDINLSIEMSLVSSNPFYNYNFYLNKKAYTNKYTSISGEYVYTVTPKINNAPTDDKHAANKKYVDEMTAKIPTLIKVLAGRAITGTTLSDDKTQAIISEPGSGRYTNLGTHTFTLTFSLEGAFTDVQELAPGDSVEIEHETMPTLTIESEGLSNTNLQSAINLELFYKE